MDAGFAGDNNGEAGSAKQSGRDFVLEVCRESIRNRCKRSESNCRYAHAPSHIQVIDGKVQCCVDYLKVTDHSQCDLLIYGSVFFDYLVSLATV